ncbi:KEX2 [Candida margitis]|uniref:KEX2 n=1 Tax=Candida margitis TaxID=1775924 RepID=UPI0022262789|nr:KEX2 [Candida margitis]KAI5969333.1 KEX2 [Candida margitis]
MKRSAGFEDIHDDLINDVSSLHLLPAKKLSKRLPVPMEPRDDPPQDETSSPSDKIHQKYAEIASKLDIHDPEFATQWHLINLQYPGHDVNATGLWLEDVLGQGIVTALVDDGLDAESEDLKASFNAKGSWDFNDNGPLPLPRLYDDYHGTRCAGEIAAVKNDVCGIGVAYKSQVSGIRILSGPITSADEASAMVYGLDTNDIYSCSWGPTDNGRTVSEPELIVKRAMLRGVQEGRGGKGAIYVFASGNGGRFADSCNFDGYTNSIYSITVGAIDHKGLHPLYSESCSAVMVVTYSSGSGEHIHTTDIKKKCSSTHGGTSAAAPLASGIFSLVLSANPNLTWRDLQYINVLSATPVNEEDGNYQTTVLNRKYSHMYGYGKIDAYKMVEFAKTWDNVKPQSWHYCDKIEVNQELSLNQPQQQQQQQQQPQKRDDKVISSKVTISKEDLKVMNFEKIEHVTVKLNIDSSYRGRAGVRLVSPSGVVSDLAQFRPLDASSRGFQDWTFTSIAHWGEDGLGEWTLEVFGDSKPVNIKLVNWQLRFFGTTIDASKAETFDIEKDYSQVRRERLDSERKHATETTAETTTTQESKEESSTTTPATSSSAVESSRTSKETQSSSQEPSSSTTSTAPEPTETEEGEHVYKKDHTGQYLMGLAGVGFIIVVVIIVIQSRSHSTRRRRRRTGENYELIEYDSDDDSDNDFDDYNDDDNAETSLTREDRRQDQARDRLFEDFNAESLPDYDSGMFKIGEDDAEGEHEGGGKREGDSSPKSTETKTNEQKNIESK